MLMGLLSARCYEMYVCLASIMDSTKFGVVLSLESIGPPPFFCVRVLLSVWNMRMHIDMIDLLAHVTKEAGRNTIRRHISNHNWLELYLLTIERSRRRRTAFFRNDGL